MHVLNRHDGGTTRWIAIGTALIGSLDLVFVSSYWAAAADVPPVRILQSIATGVLGKASYEGGAKTALLGGALHYFIIAMFVLAYYVASRWIPALSRRPVAYGLAYGLLLYVLMNYIVVPLSRAGQSGSFNVPWELSSIAMHALIGVLCALFACRAARH
jgi:uncharacterized membrane protein YagU involved in acid resistance